MCLYVCIDSVSVIGGARQFVLYCGVSVDGFVSLHLFENNCLTCTYLSLMFCRLSHTASALTSLVYFCNETGEEAVPVGAPCPRVGHDQRRPWRPLPARELSLLLSPRALHLEVLVSG